MVRRTALRILQQVHRGGATFAHELLQQACEQEQLRKRDRAFLHELVLGILRRSRTLDAVLAGYSREPLAELSPEVLEALRLGVYQLLYLDGVPAFAAIHSAVDALPRDASRRAYVNGVLRAVDRECRRVPREQDRGGASARKRLLIQGRKVAFFSREVFADPEEDLVLHLAQITSHPNALVRRFLERWGREAAEELLERSNRPPPLSVRVNALRGSVEDLLALLAREGIAAAPGAAQGAVRVRAPAAELVRTESFRQGWCTIQDETAMKVAPRLEPRPGEQVLDLCAAPGGKTSHLAELAQDAATILAVDRDDGRMARVRAVVERLGLKGVRPVALDPLASAWPASLPASFPRILLDAPCSNTGVLARRPEARWRFDEQGLAALAEQQGRLLGVAERHLAPGGRLLYSTCSLEPEENRLQVRRFVAQHPDLRWLESEETLPSASGDGGFFAVLEKAESTESNV